MLAILYRRRFSLVERRAFEDPDWDSIYRYTESVPICLALISPPWLRASVKRTEGKKERRDLWLRTYIEVSLSSTTFSNTDFIRAHARKERRMRLFGYVSAVRVSIGGTFMCPRSV